MMLPDAVVFSLEREVSDIKSAFNHALSYVKLNWLRGLSTDLNKRCSTA